MKTFRYAVATAALVTLPVVSALASQGPGTTGGTATGFEQAVFVAVMVIGTCAGLVLLRLRRG